MKMNVNIITSSVLLFPALSLANDGDPIERLPLSQVLADEESIVAQQPEGYALVVESIRTLNNDEVEKIAPKRASNPDNVKRIEMIVSEQDWNQLFPQRDPAYTYLNFLKASGKYPALCGDYDDGRNAEEICRKTLATMFAHFTQETGGHDASSDTPEWRQGLYYLREVGWGEDTSGGYGICDPETWQGQAYPCGTNPDGTYKSYFGRGSKQLSYNYNYGPFSHSIYGNVEKLLNEPQLVADTWLNLASAVFFYLYPQPPKPSMLHVIDGTWKPNENDLAAGLVPGFGVTTQIINGGVECGGSEEHIQSQNRIKYYQEFSRYLSVEIPDDEVLGCKGMNQFDANGSGALNIYWDEDWSWDESTPDGRSYKCQLVAYQGPYSSFIEGDYTKCVEDKFNVTVYDDTNGNLPPTAMAGNDVAVNMHQAHEVELSGSYSTDTDGEIVYYQWQQTDSSGIELGFNSQIGERVTISVPAVEQEIDFTIMLTVTDDKGKQDSDTMTISTQDLTENEAPVVFVSGPESVVEKQTNVSVSASIEDKDESDSHLLSWRLSEELDYMLSNNGQTITFTAPEVDVDTPLSAHVLVEDSAGNQTKSSMTMLVMDLSDGGNGSCNMIDPNAGEYPAFNPDQVYTEESEPISHNGFVYQANWWVQGDEPTPENGAWDLLSSVDLPWSAATAYDGGALANYGDHQWQAQWWTQGEEPGTVDVWVNIGPNTCL
ncbi:chitinase [Vibrio sp. Isolate25]|uniref:chitinase n=1 Tax=Vibrio sp. Isolate25 TaxID=2908535 RepID=UPI001EFD54EA|nr:chitinase [Vibrio sp. Isolate25]MCG9595104.1 chitinase [Vibrio sp. Isolate25]